MNQDAKTLFQGRFVSGPDAGMSVRVDCHEATGGDCLILIWDPEVPGRGGDYWVESIDDLGPFFAEAKWDVRWDGEEPK